MARFRLILSLTLSNGPESVQTSSNAEAQLTSAEQTVATIKAEIAALKVAGVENLKQRTLNLQGQVGKLQAKLDEIYLGEIEDDAKRDAAKQRRKAMNALLETDFPTQITDLKKLW